MNKKEILEKFQPTEQEIIKMLAAGSDYDQICEQLDLRRTSLYVYISKIIRKSESFIDYNEDTPKKEQLAAYFRGVDTPQAGHTPPDSDIAVTEIALTPKEQKVLDLLMDGKDYKEVAAELSLALSTTKTYINAIFGKKLVNSLPQLLHLEYKRKIEALNAALNQAQKAPAGNAPAPSDSAVLEYGRSAGVTSGSARGKAPSDFAVLKSDATGSLSVSPPQGAFRCVPAPPDSVVLNKYREKYKTELHFAAADIGLCAIEGKTVSGVEVEKAKRLHLKLELLGEIMKDEANQ